MTPENPTQVPFAKIRPQGPVEQVAGQVIKSTAEHPFFVWEKGWTPLEELEPGDWIRTDNGWVEVKQVEDTGRYDTVYNLRVQDFHTYFVGDQSWGFGV
jgi:intein/homing endonuclease